MKICAECKKELPEPINEFGPLRRELRRGCFLAGAPTEREKGILVQMAVIEEELEDLQSFVISDGQPDDPAGALRVATTFQNKIDVIYVGPELYPTGRDFLERLAAATGGRSVTADRAKELAASIQQFLLKG